MYAVVYKNRVIVGPMDWNRGLFQGSLEREGVETLIPRNAPEELPLIINEDARICRVEEVRPNLNPMVEYYYGPLWDLTGDIVIANYEVQDTPVEFARSNFKQQAADVRYTREVSGTTININGTDLAIDTNRGSRDVFIQRYIVMADGESIQWKFPQGWFQITKADLGQIVSKINAHVQQAFDWEATIVSQIDDATTKQDLLNVQIVDASE